MTYQVRHTSQDLTVPGPRLCQHDHATIQAAWQCILDNTQPPGNDPVIYDVETDRVLDPFEIEDAHRQDMDDHPPTDPG